MSTTITVDEVGEPCRPRDLDQSDVDRDAEAAHDEAVEKAHARYLAELHSAPGNDLAALDAAFELLRLLGYNAPAGQQ